MVQKRLSYYWMTLSFQSGLINSIGFVLFSIYLTHMTGVFSKIGLEAEQTNYWHFFWWLAIPIVFLSGALVSTLWIEGQALKKNNPRYEWLFSLLGIFMVCISFSEFINIAGAGALWMIAFCAGAQNAVFNERSGAIMRTTHFTGTTTDLGISLARIFFKTLGSDQTLLTFEKRLASLRATSIAAFVLGSILGSLLAINIGPKAFLVPAFIYFAMSYDSTKVLKLLNAKK